MLGFLDHVLSFPERRVIAGENAADGNSARRIAHRQGAAQPPPGLAWRRDQRVLAEIDGRLAPRMEHAAGRTAHRVVLERRSLEEFTIHPETGIDQRTGVRAFDHHVSVHALPPTHRGECVSRSPAKLPCKPTAGCTQPPAGARNWTPRGFLLSLGCIT